MIEIRRSALVRWSPAQMFALVSDVAAYPKRFAWCTGAAVVERGEGVEIARLDLKFAGLRHSFTTRNVASPPHQLRVSLVEGPLRSLEGVWDFIALGNDGCKIALALDFDYAGFGGRALKLGFQSLATRMVDDFCREAAHAYA